MNKFVDLEDAIMAVWTTNEDLKLFLEFYYDGPQEMTIDEAYNHLEGLRCVFNLRMEKLFDTYKRKFELDEYCEDPEILAVRQDLFNLYHEPKKEEENNG